MPTLVIPAYSFPTRVLRRVAYAHTQKVERWLADNVNSKKHSSFLCTFLSPPTFIPFSGIKASASRKAAVHAQQHPKGLVATEALVHNRRRLEKRAQQQQQQQQQSGGVSHPLAMAPGSFGHLTSGRRRPGIDFFSDDEDYGAAVKASSSGATGLLPRPFHVRGSSADSTLTTDSSLMHQARAQGAIHAHAVRPIKILA